tara:strand:+ start:72 stop:659 length:588 start_codon:yes stop_codon:yes gene_type:complete
MIEFIDKDPRLTHSQGIHITYPRHVLITFGNYPIVEDIHNFIIEIKKNLNKEESYQTNVKGKKTEWKLFNNHPLTTKFINFCINKHQLSNKNLFEYFYERKIIESCWGNELGKNDYVQLHDHNSYSCILYLTEGMPLCLPELNIKITPKPGDYYFFPPCIKHYVDVNTEDVKRYSIVINIIDNGNWQKQKYFDLL